MNAKIQYKSLLILFLFTAVSLAATAQPSIDLSDLDGTNGFTVNGIDGNDRSGQSTATGDINGDGFEDLIIGANLADPNGNSGAGEIYVIFGSSSAFSKSIELSSLNGTNGFVVNGIDENDRAGWAVGSGDFNGDGVDDILIGSRDADPNGNLSAGETYVVFGDTSAFSSSFNLSTLNGTNGFVLNGIDEDDSSGGALSTGDINGDGIDDIITSASSAAANGINFSGETYVVFGDTSAFSASINLSSLNGSNGFMVNGISNSDGSGRAHAIGDINGDGIDDLIIGAPEGDPGSTTNAGEAYVVFGSTSAFSASINLSSLDGSDGFVMFGITTLDQAGSAVASGDINGDDIDDVIIGASGGDPNGNSAAGETYVVFGSTSSFSASINLSSLNGSNGFTLNGVDANDASGKSLASGDVNKDGIDDIIIGAIGGDPNGNSAAGETYVIFGDTTTFSSSINLSTLNGSNGFVLNGIDANDQIGWSVETGDVNGDGADEIIISSRFADPNGNSNAGETYVYINAIAQTITGDEGFRMLSAPSSGTVFGELLDSLFTQGFTGSDAPSASANAWTWDRETQSWVAISNQTSDSLNAGTGFLFYAYSDDNGPGEAGDAGFPKYISTSRFGGDGDWNSGSINPISDLDANDFYLAGNPFAYSIDWAKLTRTSLSETVYIYDDANSTWQTWNGVAGNISNGEIAAYQSFFIQSSVLGNAGITFEEEDTVSTSVALLKSRQEEPGILRMHAEAGTVNSTGWITFQEGGDLSRDKYDGLALQSYGDSYVQLSTEIDTKELLQINALPIDQSEEISFPLHLTGKTDQSTATISFEGLESFQDWTIQIIDNQTSELIKIDESFELELAIDRIHPKGTSNLSLPSPIPLTADQKQKGNQSRYVINFIPNNVSVDTETDPGLPLSFELKQNFPNPFNPSTNIQYTIENAGEVRLAVFNMLGQKVADLVNSNQAAGSYQISWNAAGIASGVYFYRLESAGQQLTRQMTLIK